MKYRTISQAALTAMLASQFALAAQPARCESAPDPAAIQTTQKLRALIKAAVDAHQPSVTIPKGDYRLGMPKGEVTFLDLDGLKDIKIVADGVNLICTKATRAIELDRCSNVTLQGISVDYDPLPYTQGDIVAVADDKNSIDIKIHAGYPREADSRIDIVDPKTRFRKRGMPFLWGSKAAMAGEDVVRITAKGIGGIAAVGDLASLSRFTDPGGIPHAVSLDRCLNVTLKNVTVHASPSMGFVDFESEGGDHYDGCRVVPGPKPAGATQERILSTNHDAMMVSCAKVGPLVENCVIRDAGDDSWSVQSGDYAVAAADGTRLVFAYDTDWVEGIRVGDRITAGLGAPVATVLSAKTVDKDPAWPKASRYRELTVDRDLRLSPNDRVVDLDRMGNGFVFRHNDLHSSGRLLIKASGLVEDNVLDTPHALDVCPETASPSAIDGLAIRRNKIIASGFFCPGHWSTQAGAISVTTGGRPPQLREAKGFDHIVIDKNTFIGINGVNIVVGSARNVTISNNRFVDPQQTSPPDTGADYGIDQKSVIYLAQSDGVTLSNNVIEGAGSYLSQPLVTKNVTGLVGPAPVVRTGVAAKP